MVDLIVVPAADAAGSAADGLRRADELIDGACIALAPSCGVTTRRRGPCAAPRETPRLWQGPARRLAARRERRTLESLSDVALRSRIIQALANAPLVEVAEIAVECHDDGDVVLRGSVVNLLQRAEAVRTTRHVPGVRRRRRPVARAPSRRRTPS